MIGRQKKARSVEDGVRPGLHPLVLSIRTEKASLMSQRGNSLQLSRQESGATWREWCWYVRDLDPYQAKWHKTLLLTHIISIHGLLWTFCTVVKTSCAYKCVALAALWSEDGKRVVENKQLLLPFSLPQQHQTPLPTYWWLTPPVS